MIENLGHGKQNSYSKAVVTYVTSFISLSMHDKLRTVQGISLRGHLQITFTYFLSFRGLF